MRQIVLTAIAGTARPRGIRLQAAGRHLLPALRKPVFLAPESVRFSEAVAVVYRDSTGKPVDGALIGISDAGPVRLSLVDAERGINTDDEPSWIAFGLNMSIGKLIVRQGDQDRVLPWSIIDLSRNKTEVDMPTPGRVAARDAFLTLLADTGARAH